MFKKFKTIALAMVTAAATLLGSGQAWAFGGPDIPFNLDTNWAGTCGALDLMVSGTQTGHINIRPTTGGNFSPANGRWVGGGVGTASGSITASFLEANCGLSSVQNFSATGPSGSFSTDSYNGVSFRATDDATGVTSDYEYALSGVTNTVLIKTITPIPDTTSPSVTLSSTTTTLTGTDPFTVTATFDEDVTGFDDLVNDITIANGTVTGITAVSATVYTLAVTPRGAGDVSITVPAAAAQDAASNDNTASNTLVIGNTVEITQKAIAGFMLGRANNLASNQPGLKRFLPGTFQNTFDAAVTRGNGTLSGAFAQGNTWAELTGSWSGDDNYALGSFGAHSFVNPNLLIGGMLQFDYAEDSANNASGNGYMVGPYFVAQVPDQPLFLEGRLLYGQTDNKISPLGTYTDSFETERWLAQVRATGEYQYMATTLMPLLDLTYTDDSQKAYTDSLGNVIPGQTVSLMQISVGVDFSTPISVDTGALELTGGLSGIYSSTDGGAAAPEFENWRGRTHLGLNYGMENGANLSATTFYDGIGTDYESYGASLGFDRKF